MVLVFSWSPYPIPLPSGSLSPLGGLVPGE